MAVEVTEHREDCDVCSGAEVMRSVCQDCFDKLALELGVLAELDFGADAKGRRWLDRRPEDPSAN